MYFETTNVNDKEFDCMLLPEFFFYSIEITLVVSIFEGIAFIVNFFSTSQGYNHLGNALVRKK